MMFFDIEEAVKKISAVLVVLIIAMAAGVTIWYNYNLKNEFQEGQTETNQLRQETSRLGAMTDHVNQTLAVEIQRLRQEQNQGKTELRTEIVKLAEENTKLRNQLKTQEELVQDLRQKLDREIEWRNKNIWFRN